MKKFTSIAPLMIAVLALVLFSTAFTAVPQSLTSQIWAVSVEADQGHTGSIGMNFEAAYGDPSAQDDDDYVGNYFNIDQHANTSSGVTKRYIDISSPESHGYLSENMTVIGLAEIQELFSMENFEAGIYAAVDLWYLF